MQQERQTGEELQCVLFELLEQDYAVNIHQVLSVEQIPAITRVPRTPSFVTGVMNLRGEVVPVIDLRERFGLEHAVAAEAEQEVAAAAAEPAEEGKVNGEAEEVVRVDSSRRIVIVKVEEMVVGMLVDKVKDVISIPQSNISPPPEIVGGIKADYLDGIARMDEQVLVLLNLDKTLNKQELEQLNEYLGE